MKSRGNAVFLLTFVFLLTAAGALWSAVASEEFAQANKFYEERDYSSSIRLYESILAQGKESAAVYFNLGNAYFKDGDLGHAVLYYMKAKRLDPGDEDIRHNLEFARRFSSVQMEGVELNPINTFFLNMVDPYRLATLAWLSSALFVLFVVMLILRLGLGLTGGAVRVGLYLCLVLVMISAALTTFKYRVDYLNRRAVIIAENSSVYTGPSQQSDVELQGAPGLIVQILDESNSYYNVLFENKRRGWISKDLVAEI